MRPLAPIITVLGLILLGTASCSLQAKITLREAGPTLVEATVSVADQTKAAWNGLRELDPTLPSDPLEPSLLKKGLGPGATVAVQGARTQLTFAVSDLSRLLPGFQRGPQGVELLLDRKSLRRLAGLTSWSASPAVDALIPSPESKISEQDYEDLLVYLLGPGISEASAKALVAQSAIELKIEAPRPIRAAEGSIEFSGNSALYRWPLLRVLTLEKPLRIRLDF